MEYWSAGVMGFDIIKLTSNKSCYVG